MPRPTAATVNRRHLLRGTAAVLGAGAVARLSPPPAVAIGSISGAGLTELAFYTGWRRSWDLIVPLSTDRAFPRRALIYDRLAGEAKLLAIDAAGGFVELNVFTGWRTTWESITPSGFPRQLGVSGLVLYDRQAGELTLQQIDQFGNVRPVRSYPNQRKSWSAFLPIGAAGLLAYDRLGGFASLYDIDTNGSLQEIRSYNDWRMTWDLLTTGPFTNGAMPSGDILTYDRSARQAVASSVNGLGDVAQLASFNGWRSTWSSIQGTLFLIQGANSSGTADLVLFDRSAAEMEFIDIGPGNSLTSLLLTRTPRGLDWTSVTAIGPDLLLCYDRLSGSAGFYTTNQAPIVAPTPTPVPPTPTPPVVVQSGETTVRLQQGNGNLWHTYRAESSNPRGNSGLTARITAVTNQGDKRIALILRDRDDRRKGPVFLKAGERSDAFNGLRVAGDWEARITGGRSSAPKRIPLLVEYDFE
ncbi:MAG: hypothetical protein KC442_03050 [Thermomicrobiales bacterium]|nr:hypothetical protein [Thermomicrobiales bacterium]